MLNSMLRDGGPRPEPVRLADYRPPPFLVERTELHFVLDETDTRVRSRLHLRRNPAGAARAPLELYRRGLEVVRLAVDGAPPKKLREEEGRLLLEELPERAVLECETRLCPRDNTALEGLYLSRGLFCTDCEPEGFRRITCFPDRPDVLSVFTVTLEADRERCPVLLSNGNPVSREELPGGRCRVVWHDPFPKPCYLFALVAGDLRCFEDSFVTRSGRRVPLRIYVEEKDLDKCGHAMESLKSAMRWDEENYGREYDLDVYMIVAIDDFNSGAMENKGLNLFNTACILTDPDVATDAASRRVESIVAHEYFHNWSGNRVTCRDWFQLSLKEGFTVFREASFAADTGIALLRRVEDVSLLRSVQFAEDAGPLAHPVRPASYLEISNFYTATVYEKGAEVARMLHALLGAEDFRRGAELYFERHDGGAATCEDFLAAMAEASGRDLSQFQRWYSQAGTPRLKVRGEWDAGACRYTLQVAQSCPPTPGQPHKQPLHIPLVMGLVGEKGPLPLCLGGERLGAETVLNITEREHCFVFEEVKEMPVPSLLRNFSAPVQVDFPYQEEDLLRLAWRDADPFCRWDAMQRLGADAVMAGAGVWRAGESRTASPALVSACGEILVAADEDPGLAAVMLRLPDEMTLAAREDAADIEAIYHGRLQVERELAAALGTDMEAAWRGGRSTGRCMDAEAMGRRALAGLCLSRLALLESSDILTACQEQYRDAETLQERLTALLALVNWTGAEAEEPRRQALADFHRRWHHEPLALNHWFQVQACCRRPGTLERLRALMARPDFNPDNPNMLRATVGAFCRNLINFHAADGSGYAFLAEQVLALDPRNPQLAARFLTLLIRWQKLLPEKAAKMQEQLKRIQSTGHLSRDVYEVVEQSLSVLK